MTNNKTIRSQFEEVRDILAANGYNDLAAFIDGRIEQTIKKNTTPRKPTAKQVENVSFKNDILAWMDANTLYSCADVHSGVPSIIAAGISPNRVSALLTQLKDEGAVEAVVEKRKNYYKLSA